VSNYLSNQFAVSGGLPMTVGKFNRQHIHFNNDKVTAIYKCDIDNKEYEIEIRPKAIQDEY